MAKFTRRLAVSRGTHKVSATEENIKVKIRRALLTDPLEHEPVSPFSKGLKGHQFIGEFSFNGVPAHGFVLRIYEQGRMIFKRVVPPSGIIGALPLKSNHFYVITL